MLDIANRDPSSDVIIRDTVTLLFANTKRPVKSPVPLWRLGLTINCHLQSTQGLNISPSPEATMDIADGAVPAVVSEPASPSSTAVGAKDINLRETLVSLVESNEASYINSEGVYSCQLDGPIVPLC